VIVVALLLAQAAPEKGLEAANWSCALPLIEKNARRVIDARQLAWRIADECALPYELPADRAKYPVMKAQAEALYQARLNLFAAQIQAEILKVRRKATIPLAR
jgi:hypothetical protein